MRIRSKRARKSMNVLERKVHQNIHHPATKNENLYSSTGKKTPGGAHGRYTCQFACVGSPELLLRGAQRSECLVRRARPFLHHGQPRPTTAHALISQSSSRGASLQRFFEVLAHEVLADAAMAAKATGSIELVALTTDTRVASEQTPHGDLGGL